MNKKAISIFITYFFLVLIISPTILSRFIPEYMEITLDEKRELSEFPKTVDEDIFQNLETYYNDRAPFRLTLITLQKEISQKYNQYYRKKINPALSKMLTPSWYDTGDYDGQPYLAPLPDDNNVIYGRNDWLFYSGEANIDYYKGTNLLDEETMKQWRIIYETINDLCKSKGVRFAVLIAPNKEQVYYENLPSFYIFNHEKREDIFRKYMSDSDVPFLYPIDELKAKKSDYEVYWQQDTHWNEIGAFIGLMEIYKKIDIPITPFDNINIVKREKTGGDLSNMCGFKSSYDDYEINYKPDVKISIESLNSNLEIIRSSVDSDRNLVLVSDSFRKSLKKIIAKDFKQSMVLHRNQLGEDAVIRGIKNLKEGDVLILLSVERYDTGMVSAAKKIIKLLK